MIRNLAQICQGFFCPKKQKPLSGLPLYNSFCYCWPPEPNPGATLASSCSMSSSYIRSPPVSYVGFPSNPLEGTKRPGPAAFS